MINRLLRGLLAFTLLLGSTELFTQSNAHAAYATAFRVKETTTTTGTGTLNLGGAPAGYQTFVAGIGNANTCSYFIFDSTTGAWERGIGTVTDASPDTLARTTCLSNSSHTEPSKINFGAGTKYVYVHEGDAFTAGTLAQFGATTSAQLRGIISDPTGTGALLFAGGNYGTPSALVLTNATGLPTAGLVNDAVTYAKIQNVSAASKLIGRGGSAGAGDPEEITIGTGLTMTGTTLSATGGGSGDMLAATYDPANIAQQVVGTTATQTLTNKTLTAPIMTAPVLGTPASGTATNLTGLPLTTGVTGILPSANGGTANGFTKFTGATTTEKTYTLPDSSVVIVYQGGALGTPASGTATNITGLPLTTGVTGILPSANGGTANGFTKFTGPTTAEKTFTLPNSSETLLYVGGPGGTPSSLTLTNATGLPTAGLVDDAVTYAKIQNISAASKLLGRGDSGAGDTQEITIGTGLSMTGTTLSASGGSGTVIPATNNFRVSLENGVPVSTTSQAAKATIYIIPYNGNMMATYDSSTWTYHTSSQFSIALGTLTSGKNYDVFVYNNSGTLTAEFSSAWTNDTTRADAIAQQDGVWVKSSDHSRRFVATFRTSSTTTTEDTDSQRLLFNVSNRVERNFYCQDSVDSYTYTVANWRAANGDTTVGTNRVEVVFGLAEDAVEIINTATAGNSSSYYHACGIGISSTSTNSAQAYPFQDTGGGNPGVLTSVYHGIPGLGYRYFQRLEISAAVGTTTFYGDSGVTIGQSGMTGRIKQ